MLLLVILLLVYRSPVTPVIPMATIGVAIMVVRPIVALLGLHVIKVASFTETFILAIVFGAGTDYCIFLISRFREQMAQGDSPAEAVGTTWHRVGEAITSSAATVVVGGLAMTTASVALFSTTGPAVAASVAVTLVAGLTLTPALIAIGGEKFFWPQGFKAAQPGRFWTAASQLIQRRPRRVFAWSLVPLLLLAALYPTMRLTYDERSPQPQGNDSILGLKALDRHFQAGEVLPDYVIVKSDHNLLNAKDLAAMDKATLALVHVPGVASVRSFTQPGGARVDQASVPYQVGQVGTQLQQAADKVGASQGGVKQLDNGAGQVASGARQAQSAVDLFIAGIDQESTGLGQATGGTSGAQSGALQLQSGALQLKAGATQLAQGLQAAHDQTQAAVNGLDQVDAAPQRGPDLPCRPHLPPVAAGSPHHLHRRARPAPAGAAAGRRRGTEDRRRGRQPGQRRRQPGGWPGPAARRADAGPGRAAAAAARRRGHVQDQARGSSPAGRRRSGAGSSSWREGPRRCKPGWTRPRPSSPPARRR